MSHIIEIVNFTDIDPAMPPGKYCCRIVSVTDDIIRARFTGMPHHPMPGHTCCLIQASIVGVSVMDLPTLTVEAAYRRHPL